MSALLQLRDVVRSFPAGEQQVQVLKGINLEIHAGEWVAIIGQSGSGKSTLMNILGCLDRASSGEYRVAGRATNQLQADELAALRREHFGFIFQRYHLLGDLSAQGNVEVPAVYAGLDPHLRAQRAAALLGRLGLSERLNHRPNQLSGGQQQRVSIARALMNGGQVILADEPTGALDKQSGIEVMQILRDLHAQGHTVIIVTHDPQIAAQANRVIEISDGQIISDRHNVAPSAKEAAPSKPTPPSRYQRLRSVLDRLWAAFRMALIAMLTHRMRTFLTMLGIIIGIASVVSVVALGTGSKQKILNDISGLGTNTVTVYSGKNFGDLRNNTPPTLTADDAKALAEQPYVDSVSPTVNTSGTLRIGNLEASATINGVGESFFRVRGMPLASGIGFDDTAIAQRQQDVVIDTNTQNTLFPSGDDPIGQVILIGQVPSRIIGVLAEKDSPFGSSDSLNVYLPYTTVMSRMLGQNTLRSIIVRINDGSSSKAAETAIVKLLTDRHGREDVFTQNSDSIRETIESTTQTMTLLVSAIAVISLIVGGIGVMNIMLVSVTERTQEIGVRMAVGARQGDILQQFLIEAVLVCLVGGLLGIGLALLIGQAFSLVAGGSFQMAFSTTSMLAAFLCSSAIGVVFGFLPARNAARLDPIVALARE